MMVKSEIQEEVISIYVNENNELKLRIIELENKIHNLEQLVELLRDKAKFGRITSVSKSGNRRWVSTSDY